jgi:hypothetical protein
MLLTLNAMHTLTHLHVEAHPLVITEMRVLPCGVAAFEVVAVLV